MKTTFMIAVFLVCATPAFAEDLPCESDYVQMIYAAQRMQGEGHSPAEYEELKTKTIEAEARFDACFDEYKASNGAESGTLLYGALIRKGTTGHDDANRIQ
jgi:hypothetical protein